MEVRANSRSTSILPIATAVRQPIRASEQIRRSKEAVGLMNGEFLLLGKMQ